MASISAHEKGISPLERGRRLYQQKDYPAALEAFSDAVKLCTGSLLLTALDHRAASYEKLDQLQAALRDSKQMIDLKPDRAKGYLRCGKVLQLKGEKDLAMKIYERGLRKVRIGTDDERTGLQSMFDKLRKSQDPGKCRDPFAYLPFELAHLILQNLRMRDRVICLAVSKQWKTLLESSHKLWTTFDTTTALRPVSLHALKMHLRRSKYTLDKAIIAWRADFDASKMAFLTRTCKQLRHLEMPDSSVTGDSLISALPLAQNLSTLIIGGGCLTSVKVILQTLTICQKTLVMAVFANVQGSLDPEETWPMLESLEHLDLRVIESPRHSFNLNGVLGVVPNIRKLTLVNCITDQYAGRLDLSRNDRLEYLHLRSLRVRNVPLLPPSLRHLNVDKNLFMSDASVPVDEIFDLPLLESLHCYETNNLPASLIKRLVAKSNEAGQLRRLSLGCRLLDAGRTPVEDEYPASSSVIELSINFLNLPEERVLAAVALFPNVHTLDVSDSPKVTGVAVKEFVRRGITHLNVRGCSRVSPDAIEWARAQGVEVEHRPTVSKPSQSWRASRVILP